MRFPVSRTMSQDQTPSLSSTRRLEGDALRHAIEESMLAGVAAVDAQGTQIYVNRAFCNMVGWTEAELLGARPPFPYWAPEDVEAIARALQQTIAGQAPTAGYEARFVRKNGERLNVLLQTAPLRGEAGHIAGWVASVYNLTERKQAELRLLTEHAVSRVLAESSTNSEALRRTLEAICETARWEWGALWTIDDERKELMCAQIWHRPDVTVGQFEHVSRSIRFTPGVGLPGRVWSSGKPVWVDDVTTDDNFPRRALAQQAGLHAAIAFPVLAEGRVLGVMEFFTRAIRTMEPALHQMMSSIGLMVGQLLERKRAEKQAERERADLLIREQAARAEMERAIQAKDEFLAVLSHELRTPLTPVLTAVQLMERDRSLTPEQYEVVTMIRRNVQLEARLIDDLLDLTRISRGKLELFLAPADVHQKIRHVVGICESEIRSKHLTLQLELHAAAHFVMADSARLQQMIWNILKNAIKFTPGGGTIRLRTEDAGDARLRMLISDNGAGIPTELLPTIFDAFVQGGREITRQHGGLGLGLTISRRLAEMHGGTLIAHSEGLGKGSTFTLELPLASHPEVEPAPSMPHEEHMESESRILLVEDNIDTRRVMSKLLAGDGYDVRTADSVASALRAAEAERFDLLICDIGLPDGSGLDLMRQLLSRRPIKGIALSGFGMEEDVRRSKEAGFLEHLTKPVNLHHLEAVIRQVASTAMPYHHHDSSQPAECEQDSTT